MLKIKYLLLIALLEQCLVFTLSFPDKGNMPKALRINKHEEMNKDQSTAVKEEGGKNGVKVTGTQATKNDELENKVKPNGIKSNKKANKGHHRQHANGIDKSVNAHASRPSTKHGTESRHHGHKKGKKLGKGGHHSHHQSGRNSSKKDRHHSNLGKPKPKTV